MVRFDQVVDAVDRGASVSASVIVMNDRLSGA